MTKRSVRLGADIGGTFTDVAVEVDGALHTAKTLTDHATPERGIVAGLREACAKAEVDPGEIDLVLHGTTLATNALIERRGAKTAFLTTEGFRDTVEIRTESRFDQYDLNLVVPPPLISREHRYTAPERVAASGRALRPLDEGAVRAFAEIALERGYESAAVGFLHAYANPAHERRAAAILKEAAPRLSVSISSAVSPQMREFERFNTVCANAYVRPLMERYLSRLSRSLSEAGADCPVFLIHSGGGLISVETASEFPVRLLESGPAGGAIFAAHLASAHGADRVLSFDMGGTTAKICFIDDGAPKTARSFEVARTARFKKGSGMPISIPAIEMVEIGAGGGSIASVDDMRQIRVGPASAGSEPGPACYGRGGGEATVTDADLLLGKLNPDGFAGGAIALSRAEAEAALASGVGEELGFATLTAAAGVAEIVDETMANAARMHASENGKSLPDYAMIAFGGAAPLHAARLCEKMGLKGVLVPPGAGVGSAIGFLLAPFGFEAMRGAYARLDALDPTWLNDMLAALEAEARGVVEHGRRADAELVVERKAFMRYRGQGWEIPVALPQGSFGRDGPAELRALFEREYARLFGRSLRDVGVEVLNWSVRASSSRPPPAGVAPQTDFHDATPTGTRPLFDIAARAFAPAAVHRRADLAAGARIRGPAIIEERETTTIVPARFRATRLGDGSLFLEKRAEGEQDA